MPKGWLWCIILALSAEGKARKIPMTEKSSTTVLIVENEPETLDVLIDSLLEHGVGVEVASKAGTALRTVAQFNPDIVLSVAELVDMVPESFTEALGDTPVIFTSKSDDEDEIGRLLGAGAADYIRKPYSIKDVVARVLRRAPASRKSL
jgi:DNA-binding response OmpR family regulator